MTDEEFNDLEFDEACIIDRRNFFQFYWGYLQEEELILNTFIKKSFLELKSIRIIIFITGIAVDFALNALFYTDSLITTKYKNGGALDFIISFPKTLYSYIIGFIVGFLSKSLANEKKDVTSLIQNEKNKVEFNIMARTILRKLQRKLVLYFIINFMIILFFWYYTTAFCAVYSQTQMEWLKDGLTSFGISLGLPFVICLVFATMRSLALKYSIKSMFKILKFLNYII